MTLALCAGLLLSSKVSAQGQLPAPESAEPMQPVFVEAEEPPPAPPPPPVQAAPVRQVAPAQPAPVPVQTREPVAVQPFEMEEERRAPNSFYIEGLGAGLFYSVNYERLVLEDLAVRIGFGYWTISSNSGGAELSASVISVPLSVSYLGLGGERHMLEIGAGVSFLFLTDVLASGFLRSTGAAVAPVGTVFAGYRYHPMGHAGFNFRAGAMALVARGLAFSDADPDAVGALPWLYMSAGASF